MTKRVVGSTARKPNPRHKRRHVYTLDPGIFLVRQPHGAAALRPTGDDAPTGFILSANDCWDREPFIRDRLIQRDLSQPLFADRTAVDETPQSVRQANAVYLPPIRPFEAELDITLCWIVVSIGQARRCTIIGKRERCPPIGIMVSEAD
jgi:hypothetical protein